MNPPNHLDISPAQWCIISQILGHYVPPNVLIFAYGSRVKGNAKPYSDLDLTLEHTQGDALTFKTIANVQCAFEESDLPWKVDVSDWAGLSHAFRKAIEADRVELVI